MTIDEAHDEVRYGWNHAYSPEAIAQAIESMEDQPLGYRINIFIARMCFRGIYFPMMGKLSWVKVIWQNWPTIYKMAKEGFTGKRPLNAKPEKLTALADAVSPPSS
jgi:hypothetical protein